MRHWVGMFLVVLALGQSRPALALQDLDERVYCFTPDRSGVTVLDPVRLETLQVLQNEAAQLGIADRERVFLISTNIIRVFDRRTLRVRATLDWNGCPNPGECRALLSPGGGKLYIGVVGWGGNPRSGIHVVDLEQGGNPEIWLPGQLDSGCIDASPDGRRVYVPTNPIGVLDAESGQLLQKVELPPEARVTDIAASGPESFFAVVQTGKRSMIVAVDTQTGRRAELAMPSPVTRLAVTGPETLYALGPHALAKIDVHRGKIIETLPYGGTTLSYDPDRNRLLVFSLPMRRLQMVDTRLNCLTRWLDFDQPTLGFAY